MHFLQNVALVLLFVVLLLFVGMTPGSQGAMVKSRVMAPPTPVAGSPMPSGTAGIYVQLAKLSPPDNVRKLVASHPLVAGVLLPVNWKSIEPTQGRFDFTTVKSELAYWHSQGKRVILQITLYGQDPSEDQTPAWLYGQPDVEALSFNGGGSANGQSIRVPEVWKPGFVDKFVKPLVEALASNVDGDPALAFIQVGFGHIALITAQPSKGGSEAFVAAGWTAEAWEAYCLHTAAVYQASFKRTPLLGMAEEMLTRNPALGDNDPAIGRIVNALAQQGVSIIQSGLWDFAASNLRSQLAVVRANIRHVTDIRPRGDVRIGLGNDWPIWVPEPRRSQAPTIGHDDAFLKQALNELFGGEGGVPATGMTVYYAQTPEILASNPRSTQTNAGEYYYQPAVKAILEAAMNRLLANDRQRGAGSTGQVGNRPPGHQM